MTLPKVFVTGASGFIGEEVAFAFRRAGYQVYGLVRSEQKAWKLKLNEVIPVVVEAGVLDVAKWKDIATQCSIVVHCAFDATSYEQTDKTVVSASIDILSSSTHDAHHPKLFIYTSGILVYKGLPSASHPGIKEDAEEALDREAGGFLTPRIQFEQIVLDAHKTTHGKVNGVVIRPSFVFGKGSQHFYGYFDQVHKNGKVVVQGSLDITWSEVHIDDLTDGYLRIAQTENLEKVRGQAFHFADRSRNSNGDIARAFGSCAEYTGEIGVETAQRRVREKTVIVDSEKAELLLGWRARHEGLLKEVEIYYNRWKAGREIEH